MMQWHIWYKKNWERHHLTPESSFLSSCSHSLTHAATHLHSEHACYKGSTLATVYKHQLPRIHQVCTFLSPWTWAWQGGLIFLLPLKTVAETTSTECEGWKDCRTDDYNLERHCAGRLLKTDLSSALSHFQKLSQRPKNSGRLGIR